MAETENGSAAMKLPSVNAITQQEFLAHIEDGYVLMCMAIEYYEGMTGKKVEIQERLSSQEENI